MATNIIKNLLESNVISFFSYKLKSENFASEARLEYILDSIEYSIKTKPSKAGMLYLLELSFKHPRLTTENLPLFAQLENEYFQFIINFTNGKKIVLGDTVNEIYPKFEAQLSGNNIDAYTILSVDYEDINPLNYA